MQLLLEATVLGSCDCYSLIRALQLARSEGRTENAEILMSDERARALDTMDVSVDDSMPERRRMAPEDHIRDAARAWT